MRNGAAFLAIAVVGTAVLASAAFALHADGHMIFPKDVHGDFVQVPEIFFDGETRDIRWILPEKCAHVSYEVQEVGYEPDSGMLWGGGGALCALTKKGHECQADTHPEMSGDDKQWLIQASAYECEGGDYFISDAVLTSAF